jgi:hypothetical protein
MARGDPKTRPHWCFSRWHAIYDFLSFCFDFPILQNYGRCVDKTYMPLLVPAPAYSELMRPSRPLFMTFLEKKIRHECSVVSPLNRPSAVW